jgi:protein-disulfide isomerase
MASRTKQKEEARARRLAEERARAERARRQRRLQMVFGTVVAAVVIVVAAIVISSGGSGGKAPSAPTSSAGKAAATRVDSLLAGIPESGNTLGSPSAKITVTEFGDLECSICDEFALPTNLSTAEGGAGSGYENQLISQYVRTGKVKLVYRSLETASSESPIANVFPTQQAAAVAAGFQNKEWYYVELFYNQQGEEGTAYVTTSYLNGLASQVPGLNIAEWSSDRLSSRALSVVQSDESAASSSGFNSTPTIVVQGPKGVSPAIVGLPTSFSQLTSAIKSVE